jgi:DMSO/TMAO reductase YedYZ molybdopterin-dependent catalytic subunit
MNRRDWLKLTPLAALPLLANRGFGQDAPRPFPGMTVRMQTPQNLEYPMTELQSFLTPTEQFYIRSHFPTPKLDADFSLTVSGHVETPLKLSLSELKALSQVEMPLTLECAGNGRVFLVPQVRGLQWANGAVGTATWGGVSLAAVLERAKLKPGAVEVLLVGADSGAVTSDPPSPGVIPFDRSIPITKAIKPETILATQMNGEPLTASHGAPLRAVIGGWFGMAAVKWLKQIIVLDKPYNGFWQSLDYSYFERKNGLPSLTPITAMLPKAVIARPAMSEVIPVGKPYKITGVAWAGEEEIARVEISLDGGTTWADVTLMGEKKPFCWRLWEFVWANPGPRGPVKLVAKATTTSGSTQPLTRDADRRTYMINHLVPTEVLVK